MTLWAHQIWTSPGCGDTTRYILKQEPYSCFLLFANGQSVGVFTIG